MIEINCEICGKVSFHTVKQLKDNAHNFCSRKCHYLFEERKTSPRRMKTLEKEYGVDKANTIREKLSLSHKGQHNSIKTEFKKGFHPKTEFKKGANHLQWRGGISAEPYSFNFDKVLKEKIRERDGYRCQQCFRHQDELRTNSNRHYKLSIHHIDYNKKNCDEKNLVSLCKTCHAQTNFGREDWENYFKNKIGEF